MELDSPYSLAMKWWKGSKPQTYDPPL